MPIVDASSLRALAGALDGDARVFAVRGDPIWTGDAVLDGTPPIRVQPCASPLAARAAVVDAEASVTGELLAIITPCSDGELGHDLIARLAKRKVLTIDPFAMLLSLFDASALDPALAREDRWLVEELVAIAPPGGWRDRRPRTGFLDRDLAWEVWHEHHFPRLTPPDDLPALLSALRDPAVATTVAALSPDARHRLATRWAHGAAPCEAILEVVAAGRAADLCALGLVAGVLWAPTDDPALGQVQLTARVRLEHVLGRDRLDASSAKAWADAAAATIGPDDIHQLDRAHQLLATEAVASELAVLSDLLPAGFEQRLARLAAALVAGDVPAAEAVLAQLRKHRSAEHRSRRVRMAEAAVRVLRRQPPTHTPQGFVDAVRSYADDGAWLDEARRLLADGEQSAELAAAYRQLCQRLDTERSARDRRFGDLLAAWSPGLPATGAGDLVPVEDLLEAVVAPVARAAPVLLIVCDGMSLSTAHEVLRNIRVDGWMEVAPTERDRWPVGVAMLPTVTEVSRASLLAGGRVEGGQAVEREGFAAHRALRAVSSPTRPPVLFHKGDLVGRDGYALADPVQRALADPDQRVVGVVLNAVDDHLSRGEQVQVEWNLDTLRPLGALLDVAADAGRLVIVTADHGHVLHGEGAVLRPSGTDNGERWRTSPPPPGADEIEVHGPRVLKGGRVVLPTDARIRYGGHKHGYHGGATPQEVLVPVVVVARFLPEGWQPLPSREPAWWSGRPPVSQQVLAAPAQPAGSRAGTRKPAEATQLSMLEPDPAPRPAAAAAGGTSWVGDLLASAVFRSQLQRVKLPRPVPADVVERYLTAIDANGGSIPLATLATRVGEAVPMARATLALVQRLVNVDGSEILVTREGHTVELNRELARIQFAL